MFQDFRYSDTVCDCSIAISKDFIMALKKVCDCSIAISKDFVMALKKIYESETQRFSIQASSSKALISNNKFQDSDSDVEEDQRTINEFMVDFNVEYHERALLANQKRFYKRYGRVGSARKPINKTKETFLLVGKPIIFKKTALQTKPPHLPIHPQTTHSTNSNPAHHPQPNILQNTGNHQKDYKEKYKGLKSKMALLTKRIDDLTKGKSKKRMNEKGKSEKGLIAESFDWNEESVSSKDERTTRIRAFMEIAEMSLQLERLMQDLANGLTSP
nr:hypothetical protein [Tanacetum cinerariifolium]